MLNEKQLKRATKWYNDIMNSICREHNTIGTNYSENTDSWTLRDMVAEMYYTLEIYNDPNCIYWMDAHDESQSPDKPWYKNWINEKRRMERFINKYKDIAMEYTCKERHCSIYD